MKLTNKTESLNLRIEPRIKSALRDLAEVEHRTLANMVEYLIVDYCGQRGVSVNSGQLTMPLHTSNRKKLDEEVQK